MSYISVSTVSPVTLVSPVSPLSPVLPINLYFCISNISYISLHF